MAISAKKYPISISKEQLEYFRGFTPSLGSGLQFINKDKNEVIKFLAVTDRGPNSQHEVYEDSIVYYTEDYVVTILELELALNQNKTVISRLLPIMNNKKGVSGINPDYYAADEATYSTNREQIYSKFGIDSEAISITTNGDYIIAEEYYPSIITVNPINGQMKEIYTPKGFEEVNDVLPEVLKYRYVNRGFESLAVAPNGKVYTVLEGPLNFE